MDALGYVDAKEHEEIVVGTCRFDTRIDWILLTPHTTLLPTIEPLTSGEEYVADSTEANQITYDLGFVRGSYCVVDTKCITDHNMVIAEIAIAPTTSSSSRS